MLKILEQIKNNLDEAFIIMGDFNNIMNSGEKRRGDWSEFVSSRYVQGFY